MPGSPERAGADDPAHRATTRAVRAGRRYAAALVTGLVLRVLMLPFQGTGDVLIWKCWSYNATTSGASRLYGVGATATSSGTFHLLKFRDFEAIADYPPLSL